jgi:hypothetical protein
VRRAPLAVALVAGLLLTGCGIPDETDVVPLRPGPSTGISSGDDPSPPRNMRADNTDPAGFAKNYLEAAAGDFAGAGERVKQFLSPDAAATFRAPTEIKVVRLTEEPLVNPGKPVVIKTRAVGTLGPKGILEPATDNRPASYELTLRQIDGQQGLFVTDPPKVLLLSDSALNRFYTKRTIYFWNQEHTGLVPDVRYMPTTVPLEQQPTEIIDWLTNGPSPWLAGVVAPLPEGTKQIGNVPAISNETLQISLSGQALLPDDPTSLDRLQKQLRWSLRPNLPNTLHLTVEHQEEKDYTGTDYLTSNAAYRTTAEPERFVVYNGQIRRLARSYNSSQPVPILKAEDNRGVRMAAMSTSGSRSYVALVVNESGGKQALKVGAAGTGEQATLRRIPLSGTVGRPVWGKSLGGADSGTTGLITAGGKLYSFAADGSNFSAVEWPGGPGHITAVAVAPDARRVALLAGGRLYVAALSGGDGAQLSSPHVVHTELREPTAVDWSSEGLLVVAGVRTDSQRVAIMEVSIDGAAQTERLPDLGSNPVTYLTAVPANPTRGEETSGAIAYVLDNAAYDEVNPGPIEVTDLAEQVTDPPKDVLPGAPFFLN